ncbi:class I SAM-dependent methyltransferase [Kurthia gibsonii]|uniref:class I SAM-dependent methyltransferase n=1 Tax=Kurthia gibsonii TaxID=33946 RepID=UPI0034CD9463
MCKIRTVATTGGRPDALSIEKARFVGHTLQIDVVPRDKKSVQKIAERYEANVIVAGKNRYEYYAYGAKEPFFFHPSSAAFRVKRLAKGQADPLLELAELKQGDSFLDCTLGLGTDSMMAAVVVGEEGRVVGCEANPNVAFIVKQGLQHYDFESEGLSLLQNMRRIEVVSQNAVDYLKTLRDNTFDVVYLDPMFEETIEESVHFQPLRQAGVHDVVTEEWMTEAKRVAKRSVVLKAHYRSTLFEDFHFQRMERKNTKFHFGIYKIG